MVSAVSLETNQHQPTSNNIKQKVGLHKLPLAGFFLVWNERMNPNSSQVHSLSYSWICMFDAWKSKQTIFPNGGEQRWWIPWLESVKKHKNKSKKPNKPINQTKPNQNQTNKEWSLLLMAEIPNNHPGMYETLLK